jgi:hypothetical protein
MAISPPIPMITIAAMAEIGNHGENGIWPTLDWATWLFDRASLGLIVGTVAVLVSTVLIVWMGIVKEHHWDSLREKAAEKTASLESETAKANRDTATAHERIAELNKETARLSADAEQSRSEIATANERAAEANRVAEGERLARLKLETAQAWRTLSPDQMMRIANKVRAFSGKKVEFLTYRDDPEPPNFTEKIATSVHHGGWEIIPAKSWIAFNVVIGVIVEFAPSRASEFAVAAKALSDALRDENVDSTWAANPALDTDNIEIIRVRVGKKAERVR